MTQTLEQLLRMLSSPLSPPPTHIKMKKARSTVTPNLPRASKKDMGCFVNFRVFAYGWNTDVIKHTDKEQKKKMEKKKKKKDKHLGAL